MDLKREAISMNEPAKPPVQTPDIIAVVSTVFLVVFLLTSSTTEAAIDKRSTAIAIGMMISLALFTTWQTLVVAFPTC